MVIGSGPSGQKAAIQAAKLGKRVAVAERRERVGGVSIHTGTIPSKTLREAVLEQLAQRPMDVLDPTRVEESEKIALEQLMDRTARVIAAETAVVREQFRRNRVGLLPGQARFLDANTVRVEGSDEIIRARRVVIACGTRPARPASVEFDDRTVIDSDGLLKLDHRVPRTMTVVGAGVIGVEYASMFGALGTKVTVVDKRDRVLPFLDSEIGEAFQYLLRRANVTFRMRESVTAVELDADARGPKVSLASGKELVSETVLYAIGRQGDTEALELDKAGLEADRAWPDPGRRRAPHEGPAHLRGRRRGRRRARRHGDGAGPDRRPARVRRARRDVAGAGPDRRLRDSRRSRWSAAPRRQLTDAAIPYVTGVAHWRELARGLMSGDEDGMLKLLVSSDDRSLLGVHVIGKGATDLVHIGQAVMGGHSTIDFLVTAVFNYPTFAESYKVAALDAANRIKRPA